jgi:hypothetical protein
MAMTYQYGYGVQSYGAGGYGGFAEKYAEQLYKADDAPLIAYNNLFQQAGSIIQPVLGAYLSGNGADNNFANPLIMKPAAGVVKIIWQPANTQYQNGFGVSRNGYGSYGGYIAAPNAVSCFILAASRHESAGYRTPPSRVRIFAESGYGQDGCGLGCYGGSVVDKLTTSAANASELIQFQPVNAVRVSLWMWGLPAIAVLPEIFLGQALKMPYLEMGFDPYHEVSTGQSFLSESGREYPQLRYRKMELNPRWSYLEQARWQALDLFREQALELKAPFYFSWMPNTRPTETYFVRNNAKAAPMPYVNAQYRSLSLSLVEVL